MSEEKKDPKEGEEKQPSGTGQPEKKETTDSDEEKVEISKSELQKLEKKSKDFDGMVEADKNKNRAGRTIPGAEPVKKEDKDDDELTEEFVTKKDYRKQIEKSAMAELQKNPDIDDHWDEVMEFWTPRATDDTDTVEGLLAIGNRAYKVWKSQQPPSKEPEKKDDEDKKAKSDLAQDAGLGKGADKNPKPEKKSIIPKKEKMEDWYSGKGK